MQTLPFDLTYRTKPKASMPKPELTRISYGQRFVEERLQMLKKARQIAVENSVKKANEKYEQTQDEKAKPHNLNERDKAYTNNEIFLGKIKKIAQI
jgi:hypothetical protein